MDPQIELHAISANVTQAVRRRLILWAIRWLIGFGAIAILTHFWSASSWLWWVGGAVAALSLGATLIMHFIMQRKIAAVRTKIDEAERLAVEFE